MSHQINVSTKQCGTCRYWNGDRSIRINAGKPLYVITDNSKHNCLVSQTNYQTYATNSCANFNKWEKL